MKPEYLNIAIIEITPQCNLRCVHCYNWWKQEDMTSPDMGSYKKAFRLLNHLIRKTTVKRITFTGGEPCISERFVELVLHAKLKGKRVTIITNGNGSSAVYHQLAKMKVDMMEFSIHSSEPEIHDRITGVPGSWEKAIGNMKQMMKSGIYVTPVIVITSLNYQTAEDTVHFFRQMGINSIMINRYNIGGEGLNHPNLPANAEQLRDAFGRLNKYVEKHAMNLFSGVCTPFCLLNPKDYPHIRFGACSPDVYRRPLTLDLDGNLRLCNHSPVKIGNIYKQSLREIFANPYISAWEDLDIAFCKKCVHLHTCKGGCRAASEQTGLTLKNEDPIINTLRLAPFSTISSSI